MKNWILCSEKLPEFEEPVIIQTKNGTDEGCPACLRLERGHPQWFAQGYIHIWGVKAWRYFESEDYVK